MNTKNKHLLTKEQIQLINDRYEERRYIRGTNYREANQDQLNFNRQIQRLSFVVWPGDGGSASSNMKIE
jgi:hypothetical protein